MDPVCKYAESMVQFFIYRAYQYVVLTKINDLQLRDMRADTAGHSKMPE